MGRIIQFNKRKRRLSRSKSTPRCGGCNRGIRFGHWLCKKCLKEREPKPNPSNGADAPESDECDAE